MSGGPAYFCILIDGDDQKKLWHQCVGELYSMLNISSLILLTPWFVLIIQMLSVSELLEGFRNTEVIKSFFCTCVVFFPWRLNQSSEMKGRVDVLIHISGLNVSFLTVSSLGQRPLLVIPVKMWFRDCWRAAFKVPCSSLWLNLQHLVPSAPHLSLLDALYFSCWSRKISKDGILPTLNINEMLKRLSFVLSPVALGQIYCAGQSEVSVVLKVKEILLYVSEFTTDLFRIYPSTLWQWIMAVFPVFESIW